MPLAFGLDKSRMSQLLEVKRQGGCRNRKLTRYITRRNARFDMRGGDKIRIENKTLAVPADAKLVELETPAEYCIGCCEPASVHESRKACDQAKDLFDKALMPGNLLDLELEIASTLRLQATPRR